VGIIVEKGRHAASIGKPKKAKKSKSKMKGPGAEPQKDRVTNIGQNKRRKGRCKKKREKKQ
jgi:hypothetical protein